MRTTNKRTSRRRLPQAIRKPRRLSLIECLERRLLLTAHVTWNGSQLTVADNADGSADSVSFDFHNENGIDYVLVSGTDGLGVWDGFNQNPKVACSDVKSVSVTGSLFPDTLDASGITPANGYDDANHSLNKHVSVSGGVGGDTIKLSLIWDSFGSGGAGNDTVSGFLGSDTIKGDGEDDDLFGGGNKDSIFGGAGNDDIIGDGQFGVDYETEGAFDNNDSLYGEDGQDLIYGDGGDDVIDLGTQAAGDAHVQDYELASGGTGKDTISSVNTNASISAGTGNDTVYLGGAQKFQVGGTPIVANYASGDDDNDLIVGGASFDSMSGGNGYDDVWGYASGQTPVAGDLIDGGAQCDRLTGTPFGDIINGGSGDDDIQGEGGDDTLDGGSGNDYVDGAKEYDILPEECHPTVLSLSVTNVTRPDNIVLGAEVDGHDAEIVRVDFYKENGGDGFDPNVDTWIGSTDVEEANGKYEIIYSSRQAEIGNTKYWAIATNEFDEDGNAKDATGNVQQEKAKAGGVNNADESGASAGTFTIQRELSFLNDAEVTFSLDGGTATWEDDFTVTVGGVTYDTYQAEITATIPAGQSEIQVSINPVSDQLVEGDETVVLTLQPSEDCVPDTPSSGTLTIFDAPPAVITFDPATAEVAEGGSVDITVVRSGNTSGAMDVYYSVMGTSSATEGEDYTLDPSGYVVHFADGQSQATLTIDAIDDAFPDPYETIDLEIAVSSNYVQGDPYDTEVTIIDNDDYGDSLTLNLPPREARVQPGSITSEQAAPYLQAAAREWAAAGVDPATLHRLLAGATVRVADLPGSLLGATANGDIYLDDNAAGYGWFLDDRLHDAGDFMPSDGAEAVAPPGSPAYGRVDLLTAVAHELGHLLGLSDLSPADAPGDVMASTIGLSTRRVPMPGEDPQSDAHAKDGQSEAAANMTFGGFDADAPLRGSAGQAGASDSPSSAAAAHFWKDFGELDHPAASRLGAVRGIDRSGLSAER